MTVMFGTVSWLRGAIVGAALLALPAAGAGAGPAAPESTLVRYRWAVSVPLRDGVKLHASLYTPRQSAGPVPCVFTLTPYTTQSYHDRGVAYASHGLVYLVVDSRGRGDSEGQFKPFIQEANDGYDVTEWLAQQPYCNGKVAMSGGSYTGYDQWATAKEFPPHLATIVPTAAPYAGVDFPMRGGNFYPYLVQWLTMVAGHTLQGSVAADGPLWNATFREWFESGLPFSQLDAMSGGVSPVFHEWLAHPQPDPYWDSFNPTPEQYARLAIPILTITGSYDDDQPGALTHYRQYMRYASPQGRARHFLVIGPWDHAGTHAPAPQVGGLSFGPASLLDIAQLHVDWYAWTMRGGPQPDFLRQAVAYYVTGAELWRYADSLEAVTREQEDLYLVSDGRATDVLHPGMLLNAQRAGPADRYVYDPRDISLARLEEGTDPASLTDQSLLRANRDKLLVYHTETLAEDTEISGFFSLSVWLSIDQPDTDFEASVYELRQDGTSVLLTRDLQRARYRESSRQPKLITDARPLPYQFNGFTFMSRRLSRGSRLRLVFGPVNSIFAEKNHNSGGEVSAEAAGDSRKVTVRLYHDAAHPSVLHVPLGAAPSRGFGASAESSCPIPASLSGCRSCSATRATAAQRPHARQGPESTGPADACLNYWSHTLCL